MTTDPDREASIRFRRADPDDATIAVVGLGYVGLSVASAFARAGLDVVGYDVDETVVEQIESSTDPTGSLDEGTLADIEGEFTTDPAVIADAEYVIIAVPTPTDGYRKPEMGFVEAAAETVGRQMAPGTTVVLESTVFPGATEDTLVPVLERASGLTADEEFHVGYSHERISPGEGGRSLHEVVKVVSGRSDAVRADVARLYRRVVDAGVHEVSSVEVAEAVKLFENVQRDVNIALINELAMACTYLGIDIDEAFEAAATKWNFHEYSPGLVGGHCIPVDPAHYVYGSERAGFTPSLVLEARSVNEYVPRHVTDLVIHTLNQCRKVPAESRLLVLGFAFKPNTAEVRTSRVPDTVSELANYDVEIHGYDPHADASAIRSEADVRVLDRLDVERFDGALVATGHEEFRSLDPAVMAAEMADDPFVVDVPGVIDGAAARDRGIVYERL